MSNNLLSISHAINDSGAKPQLQAPPQPAPPKVTAAKKKEDTKQEEKIEQKNNENLREDLYCKILSYFDSEELAKFIPTGDKRPKASDSLEVLQAQHKSIVRNMNMSAKRIMVDTMYTAFANTTEQALVKFFQVHNAVGVTQRILEAKEEKFFQPELELIAIELSNSMVPNPYIALALKTYAVTIQYLNSPVQTSNEQRTTA